MEWFHLFTDRFKRASAMHISGADFSKFFNAAQTDFSKNFNLSPMLSVSL